MKKLLKGRWAVPVATLVLTLSIGSAAFAATKSDSTGTTTADTSTAVTSTAAGSTDTTTAGGVTSNSRWGNQRSDETLLTGSTAEQVKAVAVAEVGSDATVVRVETDADGVAKYEVHMIKADGTRVTVYVDESFKLVSVEDQPCGGRGHGARSDETLLTGTTAEQVKAAALAKVGSEATVIRVESDGDGNAKYEAHMELADGTHIVVYVDESLNVVSVEERPIGGRRAGAPDSTSTNSTATDSTSTSM